MRVGIVTPAWNVAPWIGAAIHSVLAQSHTDWRMVVVDDGSTDATASLAAGFVDVRLRLLRQAWRRCCASTRMTGWRPTP